MYVDYCDLLDELLVLSRREDLEKVQEEAEILCPDPNPFH